MICLLVLERCFSFFTYPSNRISGVPSSGTFHCPVSRRPGSRSWACWRTAWAICDRCARRRCRGRCCRRKWYVSLRFARRWYREGCTPPCRCFRWVSLRSEASESVDPPPGCSDRFVDPSRFSVPGRWSLPREYRLRRCTLPPRDKQTTFERARFARWWPFVKKLGKKNLPKLNKIIIINNNNNNNK